MLSLKPAGAEAAGCEIAIINSLCPCLPAADWGTLSIWVDVEADEVIPQFSRAELELAAIKLPPGKAPGSDGIFNEVLLALVKQNPSVLLMHYSLSESGGLAP